MLPGDEARIVEGAYGGTYTPPSFTVTSALGNVRLLRGPNLSDKQFVMLRGLNIHSAAGPWLTTNGNSSDHVINCHFTSEWLGNVFNFAGITLRGKRHTLKGKVETWYGGDAIQCWSDDCLIDIDASECNVGHAVFIVYGSRNVIGGKDKAHPMLVTNLWGRVGAVIDRDDNPASRNLLQNMHFDNCNWDGIVPVTGYRQNPGDAQILQIGGPGLIVRDVTITNSRFIDGVLQRYSPLLDIANYFSRGTEDPCGRVNDHMRLYHLRLVGSRSHGVTMSHNPALPFSANDMRLFDSVIDTEGQDVYFSRTSPYQEQFVVEGIVSSSDVPNNALATVEAVSGDLLTLSDAWRFYEGNALVAGDRIVVEGDSAMTTRIMARLDNKSVRVSPAINAKTGDLVWLEGDYEMSDTTPVAGTTPPVVVTVPVVLTPNAEIIQNVPIKLQLEVTVEVKVNHAPAVA